MFRPIIISTYLLLLSLSFSSSANNNDEPGCEDFLETIEDPNWPTDPSIPEPKKPEPPKTPWYDEIDESKMLTKNYKDLYEKYVEKNEDFSNNQSFWNMLRYRDLSRVLRETSKTDEDYAKIYKKPLTFLSDKQIDDDIVTDKAFKKNYPLFSRFINSADEAIVKVLDKTFLYFAVRFKYIFDRFLFLKDTHVGAIKKKVADFLQTHRFANRLEYSSLYLYDKAETAAGIAAYPEIINKQHSDPFDPWNSWPESIVNTDSLPKVSDITTPPDADSNVIDATMPPVSTPPIDFDRIFSEKSAIKMEKGHVAHMKAKKEKMEKAHNKLDGKDNNGKYSGFRGKINGYVVEPLTSFGTFVLDGVSLNKTRVARDREALIESNIERLAILDNKVRKEQRLNNYIYNRDRYSVHKINEKNRKEKLSNIKSKLDGLSLGANDPEYNELKGQELALATPEAFELDLRGVDGIDPVQTNPVGDNPSAGTNGVPEFPEIPTTPPGTIDGTLDDPNSFGGLDNYLDTGFENTNPYKDDIGNDFFTDSYFATDEEKITKRVERNISDFKNYESHIGRLKREYNSLKLNIDLVSKLYKDLKKKKWNDDLVIEYWSYNSNHLKKIKVRHEIKKGQLKELVIVRNQMRDRIVAIQGGVFDFWYNKSLVKSTVNNQAELREKNIMIKKELNLFISNNYKNVKHENEALKKLKGLVKTIDESLENNDLLPNVYAINNFEFKRLFSEVGTFFVRRLLSFITPKKGKYIKNIVLSDEAASRLKLFSGAVKQRAQIAAFGTVVVSTVGFLKHYLDQEVKKSLNKKDKENKLTEIEDEEEFKKELKKYILETYKISGHKYSIISLLFFKKGGKVDFVNMLKKEELEIIATIKKIAKRRLTNFMVLNKLSEELGRSDNYVKILIDEMLDSDEYKYDRCARFVDEKQFKECFLKLMKEEVKGKIPFLENNDFDIKTEDIDLNEAVDSIENEKSRIKAKNLLEKALKDRDKFYNELLQKVYNEEI